MAKLAFTGGAFHDLGSGDATSLPIKEVGSTIVFDAAFDNDQRVGARFRPVTPIFSTQNLETHSGMINEFTVEN